MPPGDEGPLAEVPQPGHRDDHHKNRKVIPVFLSNLSINIITVFGIILLEILMERKLTCQGHKTGHLM